MAISLDRRTLLRGMFGGAVVTLALPRLGIMLNGNGTAYADGSALPRRFGVWAWGCGVKPERWVPQKTGPDWELTEELAPLSNVKDYVTVVSGTEVKTGGRAHGAPNTMIMTGAELAGTNDDSWTAQLPSIDQLVGNHMKELTPLKSLVVGVNTGATPEAATGMQYFSHNGPNNPNIPSYNCLEVWTRLFSSINDGSAAAELAVRMRQNALDLVRQDVADLNKVLGKEDRTRLEQHLEGIGAIQRRLNIAPPKVTIPGAPSVELVGHADRYDARYEEINLTMSQLIATALASDLTRVFVLQLLSPGARPKFLDHDQGLHDYTHGGPEDQEKVHQIVTYCMGQFAVLLETLKNTPDVAGGNLLDSCAILATSDVTDGLTHVTKDYPILVAGKAHGALKAGIHYRAENDDNACKVPLTLARAVGVPLDAFGLESRVTDSLTGITATV